MARAVGLQRRCGLGIAVVVAAVLATHFARPVQAVQTSQAMSPTIGNARVRLSGPSRLVFDWGREACGPNQVADLPVRVFRDYRGRVQLLLSHFENFRMVGPSLDRLRVDCRAVMRSSENASPARYRDRQWIASLYTEDGRNVWALVHDEYQGNHHPGRCPQNAYFPCWYNAITLARSDDAGRSYHQQPGPADLVAGPPYPYQAGIGPAGVFAPSNIVNGHDGYLYALVHVRDPNGPRGDCLIRTKRLSGAHTWRAWDGQDFNGVFTDPYRSPVQPYTPCARVAMGRIAEMTESLTFNTALGSYLLVGIAPPGPLSLGPKVTGIYFSLSRDLVDWTPRRLVLKVPTASTYRCGGPSPIAYPSLVDPGSHSRTFATTGSHPYLYYTQFRYKRCRQTPDRDLMRVRVEVSG